MKYKIDFLYERKKSIEFGLTLLGMPQVRQNYKSGIYSKDRYVQISHWSHCSHWFQISPMISLFSVDLSLLQLASFLMEKLTVFFLIFCDEVTSLLTSKSWLLYCCRNFSLFVFGQKKVFAIDFLGNSLKGELLSCLTFHPSFLVEQSSRSWVVVKDQLSNDQILRFLKV